MHTDGDACPLVHSILHCDLGGGKGREGGSRGKEGGGGRRGEEEGGEGGREGRFRLCIANKLDRDSDIP